MKVFDPGFYNDIAVTAYQAEEIAKISDQVLKKASFVLYGRYQDEKYLNFTSFQKPGDTHCLLAFLPKKLLPSN